MRLIVPALLIACMVIIAQTRITSEQATFSGTSTPPPTSGGSWIVQGTIANWGGDTIPARRCVERNFPSPGTFGGDRLVPGYPPTLEVNLIPWMYGTPAGVIVVKICNVSDVAVAAPNGATFSAEIRR